MPQMQLLRIVVTSLGDVQAERDALAVVVDELNHGLYKVARQYWEYAHFRNVFLGVAGARPQ